MPSFAPETIAKQLQTLSTTIKSVGTLVWCIEDVFFLLDDYKKRLVQLQGAHEGYVSKLSEHGCDVNLFETAPAQITELGEKVTDGLETICSRVDTIEIEGALKMQEANIKIQEALDILSRYYKFAASVEANRPSAEALHKSMEASACLSDTFKSLEKTLIGRRSSSAAAAASSTTSAAASSTTSRRHDFFDKSGVKAVVNTMMNYCGQNASRIKRLNKSHVENDDSQDTNGGGYWGAESSHPSDKMQNLDRKNQAVATTAVSRTNNVDVVDLGSDSEKENEDSELKRVLRISELQNQSSEEAEFDDLATTCGSNRSSNQKTTSSDIPIQLTEESDGAFRHPEISIYNNSAAYGSSSSTAIGSIQSDYANFGNDGDSNFTVEEDVDEDTTSDYEPEENGSSKKKKTDKKKQPSARRKSTSSALTAAVASHHSVARRHSDRLPISSEVNEGDEVESLVQKGRENGSLPKFFPPATKALNGKVMTAVDVTGGTSSSSSSSNTNPDGYGAMISTAVSHILPQDGNDNSNGNSNNISLGKRSRVAKSVHSNHRDSSEDEAAAGSRRNKRASISRPQVDTPRDSNSTGTSSSDDEVVEKSNLLMTRRRSSSRNGGGLHSSSIADNIVAAPGVKRRGDAAPAKRQKTGDVEQEQSDDNNIEEEEDVDAATQAQYYIDVPARATREIFGIDRTAAVRQQPAEVVDLT